MQFFPRNAAIVAAVFLALVLSPADAGAAAARHAKKNPPAAASGGQKATAAAGKLRGSYNVKSAIAMDVSRRRIVYEQAADRVVAPASLTKILAMYVILDKVRARKASLDAFVPVSRKAAATGGSQMGIRFGEKLRLRDLLAGMAVASGNDAAVAAAQHVAGSEEAFVRLMNQKARQIGMQRSVFKNVHGLPAEGQQTTARDMLRLAARYIADHPEALSMFHSRRYLDYRGYTPNTNPLLGISGVDGLKTGYVYASGFNLITTARRDKIRLVAVLLGAPDKAARVHEGSRLVESGFRTADAMAARDTAQKTKDAARKGIRGRTEPVRRVAAGQFSGNGSL